MHASINIHIAANFFPPKKGVRNAWGANPKRITELFATHPARVKNLQFAFVVLLRALRKAAPQLYEYPIVTGDDSEDVRTRALLHRLLDSHILKSCAKVFSAFDESMLFHESPEILSTTAVLKTTFKGVFRNISKVLDCVSCQKCKLHGKMQLLGIGAALKVLLTPPGMLESSLSREEVIALVNTIGKFSHAITTLKELQSTNTDPTLFWDGEKKEANLDDKRSVSVIARAAAITAAQMAIASNMDISASQEPQLLPPLQSDELADFAVGIISRFADTGELTEEEEDTLVEMAIKRDANIRILAKRYHGKPKKFLKYVRALASSGSKSTDQAPTPDQLPKGQVKQQQPPVDVVVVGGGLAGLTAAITLLDRGGRVVIVEKNKFTGGNSAYASSGINAVEPGDAPFPDSVEAYLNDTLSSSRLPDDMVQPGSPRHDLMTALTKFSHRARSFVEQRVRCLCSVYC